MDSDEVILRWDTDHRFINDANFPSHVQSDEPYTVAEYKKQQNEVYEQPKYGTAVTTVHTRNLAPLCAEFTPLYLSRSQRTWRRPLLKCKRWHVDDRQPLRPLCQSVQCAKEFA